MAESNYTRKDHREVAGKRGVWGRKGYESFTLKSSENCPSSYILAYFDNKTPPSKFYDFLLRLPFYLPTPDNKKKLKLPVLKLASTHEKNNTLKYIAFSVSIFQARLRALGTPLYGLYRYVRAPKNGGFQPFRS